MFFSESNRNNQSDLMKFKGLPEYYPIPNVDHMLFYIQRSQTTNTVIYQLNIDESGNIDRTNPFYIFWKRYDSQRKECEINLIQKELAYGIKYEFVNDNFIKCHIVSNPTFQLYVSKNKNARYISTCKINDQWSELTNVYVFADEDGAFPIVRYVEIYGIQIDNGLPCYQKIII